MRLWNKLKEYMLSYPTQVVCENDAELSFEELVIWAELFSKKLNGVKCCAVFCRSEMASAMALLACFAGGVTALPISWRYGALHCDKVFDTIGPDAIITDCNGYFEVRKIEDSSYIPPKKHPALIMCTSGTTGTPKGAMLSESNIISNVTDIAAYFAIGKDDSILISRPLYHCAVLTGEFLTALVKGTRIRFYSEVFDPSKLLELIQRFQITAFCGTPTLLGLMAKLKKNTSVDTLKHICISGECMGKEAGLRIADAFPLCDIYHIYGLTEACPRVCYLPPKLYRAYPDHVGIPLDSVSLKLLNKLGQICRTGEDGVLWVKGDNVMLGYYNDPQNTDKVLKNGWLCTGDIAVMNDKGLLKIKGRSDNLIIKAGMNIYPAEIEETVKRDPRVKEVLVYGFENKFGTQIGMKIAGDFLTVEEVKRFCGSCLPSFQIPTLIELVPYLPKNGSGKVIRNQDT